MRSDYEGDSAAIVKEPDDARDGVSRTLARIDETAERLDQAIGALGDRLDYLLLPSEPQPEPGEVRAVHDPGSPVRQHADRVYAHLRHLVARVQDLTERIDL